jgi:hypothetical protein
MPVPDVVVSVCGWAAIGMWPKELRTIRQSGLIFLRKDIAPGGD